VFLSLFKALTFSLVALNRTTLFHGLLPLRHRLRFIGFVVFTVITARIVVSLIVVTGAGYCSYRFTLVNDWDDICQLNFFSLS
jgi:hypothetical protein